ncbi:MAG: hypothetical protein AAF431_00870 [Pseudomonadota bacterium]
MKNKSLYSFLLIITLLGACAPRLADTTPAGISFNGTWELLPERSQDVIVFPRAPRSDDNGEARQVGGANGGDRGDKEQALPATPFSAVHKSSAMTATEMTIEQDRLSMGVAYPGERYRDVDWGKRKLRGDTIVAGWKGDKLIIHSETRRLDFNETYFLSPDKTVLTLVIKLDGPRGNREFTRVFKRKSTDGQKVN